MKRTTVLSALSRVCYGLVLRARRLAPRRQCNSFGQSDDALPRVSAIYAINLARQPQRLMELTRELNQIVDAHGAPLSESLIRFSAVDARLESAIPSRRGDVTPEYTLADQLFVEPQPATSPDEFDLQAPIRMTREEVAIARSHIGVWRSFVESDHRFALVLEDDVWIERRFSHDFDLAWRNLSEDQPFDVLYVSYEEARHGAPKEILSDSLFRPEKGLWFLSGYVISKAGARKLLSLLPCQGPIDLWLNHRFSDLVVRAVRRPLVHQRRDLHSTNSYSILPTLNRIGVLNAADASLFHQRPTRAPIFAFGAPSSGSSALAEALLMLGYRCASDLRNLPENEFERLLRGSADRVFDAYVNITSLEAKTALLARLYPQATFLLITNNEGLDPISAADFPSDIDILRLPQQSSEPWRTLCEHLRTPPPDAPYPQVQDIGARPICLDKRPRTIVRIDRHDPSPWQAPAQAAWGGIRISGVPRQTRSTDRVEFDEIAGFSDANWMSRGDTFPGNLALFRAKNAIWSPDKPLRLSVIHEHVGVREFSAAAISSRRKFLYGRFECTMQASGISGIVTGFFLHRNCPRQEIDVEIAGKDPTKMVANVFFNPGGEGAKFDYGYRGSPAVVDLGFDASKEPHRFAIEWQPDEIRWLVDGRVVHSRVLWDPTPIPRLPMTLHANIWPSQSREFAGKVSVNELPALTFIHRITSHSSDDTEFHTMGFSPKPLVHCES